MFNSTPKQNFTLCNKKSFSASRISFHENASLSHQTNSSQMEITINRRSLCLIDNKMPKTPPAPAIKKDNPVMERIMRDMNSPSATARVRAMRALKSPNFKKANYEVFDVPYEEQSLITAEERNAKSPVRPKTIQEVFKDICVYVEIRTKDEDRSAGIKKVIAGLGAKVNDKLYKDTTHVIFKDGLQSTYNKAKKMNIPVVSILWIESCKKQFRIVDPDNFQISNKDRYENPELYKKRRLKKLQADDDILGLPKTPTSKKKVVPASQNSSPDSELEISGSSTKENEIDSTPIQSKRRTLLPMSSNRSMAIAEESEDGHQESLIEIEGAGNYNNRQSVFTPTPMEETNLDGTVLGAARSNRRRTLFTPQSMEQTNSDVLTPINEKSIIQQYRETPLVFNSQGKVNRFNNRRSLLDISMDILDQKINQINENNKQNTPKSPSVLERDRHPREKPIDLFFKQQLIKSSEKGQKFQRLTPGREKEKGPLKAFTVGNETIKEVEAETDKANDKLATQTTKPTTIKKRKLFSNFEDSQMQEELEEKLAEIEAESKKKRKSVSCLDLNSSKRRKISNENLTNKAKPPANRRLTMDLQMERLRKEQKMLQNYNQRKMNPIAEKPADVKRSPIVLVCTSMHREQIQRTKEILEKLGSARMDDRVTDKTTHVVTLENRRTMNLLRGIMRGLFIVKYEWLLESEKSNRWLLEHLFEFPGICESAQMVRQDKQTLGNRYSYDLFSPLPAFYLQTKFIKTVKIEYLREIILSAKGKIAATPSGARFVLTESTQKVDTNNIPIPEFNLKREKIVYVRPEWIFDCVYKNSVLNFRRYPVNKEVTDTQIPSQSQI